MTIDKYIQQIEDLRGQLRILSNEAMQENRAVAPKFYEIGKKLDKVWRNCHSFCRRHNLEFPSTLL